MLGECEQGKRNMPVENFRDIKTTHSKFQDHIPNRPFSYSTKEPGSSDIFIQFYTRGSIEWR